MRKSRDQLSDEHILPTMMDAEIYPLVASAVGESCVKLGISRIKLSKRQIRSRAQEIIENSQKMIGELQKSNLIKHIPKSSDKER